MCMGNEFHTAGPACEKARSPRVGHGLDPSIDWIGLDWVRILRKLCGLDGSGSHDCNPLFFFHIYTYSILTTDER